MKERISLFLKKLEGNSENLLIRFSLAQAYFEDGDYENSVNHLEICISQRSDWMIATLLLGKALIEIGQKEEACVQFKKTIELARKQGHEDPEQEAISLLAECA